MFRRSIRLSDVAADANVSVALVSRVLNGDPKARATAETKARIIEVANRLGYVPNVAAKSLRKSRTGLLGLVVHDLSSPIYLELLRGAREAAAERNYFLVLGDVDELLSDDEAFNILVNGKRVDGLVVQGGHGEFDRRAVEIARALPTVVVNAPAGPGEAGISHVYPDERAATRLLTEHLLSLGHTRIGLVSGPRGSTTNLLREAGMRSALHEVGFELREQDCVYGEWSADGGRAGVGELAGRWAGAPDRPTALIAGNSLIGMGILAGAAELGIAVPRDISVAAVHDTWLNEHLVPALTTVSLPLHEMGVVAVRQLLAGSDEVRDILLENPPVLHPRASTSAEAAAPSA
ncbi:LacI family DNA-binding transcriptional regulator [Agromyces aerolatus]|uniref:LacI family DNA-binding transcriptional regulator n=1 Tax=Agromyces sp. LY-1074 TaxID=3074080 RepID=UPI0028556FA8|nr:MULTISPECIES: LacI family DNA-binding transcriptional regulator [unclassified Agromyces]MDR5699258.1 LacI family DNA-binding transcriptional regulator [Agromyces sp. LY-1074]MDR5705554.1 LacI family DNA-binding transcriptional regulator [Agromyces sp. LY-1358]